MIQGFRRTALRLSCTLSIFAALSAPAQDASKFRFDRDTLWFANWTVWNYANGLRVREPESRSHKEKTDRYTRRCFVMARTAQQFFKFARFEANAAPIDDRELAHRVRQVTRKQPWHPALPPNERIVFPGYASLRALSRAQTRILQNNIGLGWPTYARVGNFRMFTVRGRDYQEKEHARLNETLGRGQMFVAYLSDYPILHINHAVLVYRRTSRDGDKIDKYLCYDPNHPDRPRELTWLPEKREFNFEKDLEFSGGYTRVYQVYGRPWQ